jgi:hypothetical protein
VANKYRNVRHGKYASKKEANRATELHALHRAGLITDLREQVNFELLPASPDFKRPLIYRADFVYFDLAGGRHIEDVKGFRTKEYLLKRRMMKQLLGLTIEEV